jgi:hypothetical protein
MIAELCDKIRIAEGEGIVMGRTLKDPITLDVLMTADNKMIHGVIEQDIIEVVQRKALSAQALPDDRQKGSR